MGIYALAFVAFALDLARRGARATIQTEVPSAVASRAETAAQQSAGGSTTTLTRISTRVEDEVHRGGETSKSLRVAFALTILGFAFHLAADILRGVAAGRVPWANMWEFSMTGTLVIVGVFLLV